MDVESKHIPVLLGGVPTLAVFKARKLAELEEHKQFAARGADENFEAGEIFVLVNLESAARTLGEP